MSAQISNVLPVCTVIEYVPVTENSVPNEHKAIIDALGFYVVGQLRCVELHIKKQDYLTAIYVLRETQSFVFQSSCAYQVFFPFVDRFLTKTNDRLNIILQILGMTDSPAFLPAICSLRELIESELKNLQKESMVS